MSYPPAPWFLNGPIHLACNLIDVKRARPAIPPELDIIQVWPGLTLGGLYWAAYQTGSIISYHELIVTSALVRYGGKVGSWISHIYVDNEDSLHGGLDIWQLPKQLACFTWNDHQITVAQGNQPLCVLDYQPTRLRLPQSWPPRISGNVLSSLSSDLLCFTSHFQGAIAITHSHLTIPETSPFSHLHLGQPWLTLHSPQINLRVDAPITIGTCTQPGRNPMSQ